MNVNDMTPEAANAYLAEYYQYYQLNGRNALKRGLYGVLVTAALFVMLGALGHVSSGDGLAWFLPLVLGFGLCVQWLRMYMAWLKNAGISHYTRRALELLPPLLPDQCEDVELQRRLRGYNIHLKTLRLDFQALRRDIPPAWVVWTPRRMKAGVDGVMASQEFRTMSAVSSDLTREHDELVQRLHEAENAV